MYSFSWSNVYKPHTSIATLFNYNWASLNTMLVNINKTTQMYLALNKDQEQDQAASQLQAKYLGYMWAITLDCHC